MSEARGRYTFLPQEDEDSNRSTGAQGRRDCDTDDNNKSSATVGPSPDSEFWKHLIRWAIIFITSCTIIDAVVVLYFSFLYAKNTFFPYDCPPGQPHLQLRSSYINFDQLYGSQGGSSSSGGGGKIRPTPHGPIINHIIAIAHLSRLHPNTVISSNPGGGMTINGLVPLDARRLWVNDEISTIVQFRAIDYGMENCTIALITPTSASPTTIAPVPNPNHTSTTSGEMPSDVKVMVTGSNTTTTQGDLDVWALKVPPQFNVRKLTWASRPERKEHIGLLKLEGETRTFACPSGSYHTFEISCGTPGCHLDILGVGRGESGIYVKQYQSI